MAFTTFQNSPFSEGAPFVLNSGGNTLATGYRVEMGDGTATPLFISSSGVGVVNGSNFRTLFTTTAQSNRTVIFTDESGTIPIERLAVLASDFTNSTITSTDIPAFSLTLEAGTLYEFEAVLVCQTAATTTGVQISLQGPAGQVSLLSYVIEGISTTTLATTNTYAQEFSSFGVICAHISEGAANTNFVIRVKGILLTTTAPASPLSIRLASEIAASQVTVKANSILRVVKRA